MFLVELRIKLLNLFMKYFIVVLKRRKYFWNEYKHCFIGRQNANLLSGLKIKQPAPFYSNRLLSSAFKTRIFYYLILSKIMIPAPTYQFKMVFVGDSAVGKSSLLIRFVDDKFDDNMLSTIGVDFHFRTININGSVVKLQVWDTAGQQTFRSIVSAYYHSADAIVVIYDITSYASFDSVKEYWLKEAQEQNKSGACIFLIGNKLDEATNKREVQHFSVEGLLQSNKGINNHFEMSAKNGTNVEEGFKQIIQCLISQKKKGSQAPKQNDKNIKIRQQQNNGPATKCCLK